MYNYRLDNPELTAYHKKVKCNFQIKLSDIITDNSLFNVQLNDTVYKIIPLFYCDKIISSNEADKVLDNEVLICINEPETIIKFESYGFNDFRIIHKIETLNTKQYVNGNLYDSNSFNPITDANITVELLSANNELKEKITGIKTNSIGNFTAMFNTYYLNTDNIRITAAKDNISKVFYNMEAV